MNRISEQYLQAKINRLNRMFPSADFSLSKAYGGYALYRKGEGANVFQTGHEPRRMLATRIDAFIDGISFMEAHTLERQAALARQAMQDGAEITFTKRLKVGGL